MAPPAAAVEVGTLRVRVLEASCPAGPTHTTVAVTELTRRRTRRLEAWADFEGTHSSALVVVDVRAEGDKLVGKCTVCLSDCRPGVPHVYLGGLLHGDGGVLAVRVLFDDKELPSEE